MTPGANRPGYEDVLQAVEQVGSNPICKVQILGHSVEGRAIPCLFLTDPSVPDDDKQCVLVVAGQHGTEESGRAIALELISFLARGGPEPSNILKRHVIAVIPCANPDGAVHETYRNAEGVDIAHTFAIDAPAGTPEGRAIERFAAPFAPEVVVDVHGLAGGSMKDRVWYERPWHFTPDRYFLAVMGLEMSRAAESAGFPHCETSPPSPLDPGETAGLRLGGKLAAEAKSLGFGMESIEHYYREPEWRADGLSRLRRLLRFGMEDFFGLGEPGYPASLVSGYRECGLKAHGRTALERRRNRIALVRFLRRNWATVERLPDGIEKCARVRVSSKTIEGPNVERFAVLLRIRKPCEVTSVEWEGETLGPDGKHGFRQWEDGISRLIQVNVMAPFGGPERFLTIRYDSPLFGPR